MRPLFMFVHLTNRTKLLVHVRSFIKQTNINELPVERFTNGSLNVRFVYSPTLWISVVRKYRPDLRSIVEENETNILTCFEESLCIP
ncbi:hypothetical protein Hanom_Chr01g00075361 [Helianthus anomalus]